MKITVCGSRGTLVFPEKALHDEFEREMYDLYMRTYAKIREKYGIWAGNQNKFVATLEELNDWDGAYMENEYKKYINRNY